jgi:IPT/TIG domain
MTAIRIAAGGLLTLLALGFTAVPALAGTRPVPATKALPPVAAQHAAPAARAPEVFQVNPTKVNPTVQPNIMIIGQFLTPSTTVQVGTRPATTIQVPDPNHILVKLPDNLSGGTYPIQVTNEAGSVMATDSLVVDNAGDQPSTLTYLIGGGFIGFLALVMRLARTPGIS